VTSASTKKACISLRGTQSRVCARQTNVFALWVR
jgi:hypothetical protein